MNDSKKKRNKKEKKKRKENNNSYRQHCFHLKKRMNELLNKLIYKMKIWVEDSGPIYPIYPPKPRITNPPSCSPLED